MRYLKYYLDRSRKFQKSCYGASRKQYRLRSNNAKAEEKRPKEQFSLLKRATNLLKRATNLLEDLLGKVFLAMVLFFLWIMLLACDDDKTAP